MDNNNPTRIAHRDRLHHNASSSQASSLSCEHRMSTEQLLIDNLTKGQRWCDRLRIKRQMRQERVRRTYADETKTGDPILTDISKYTASNENLLTSANVISGNVEKPRLANQSTGLSYKQRFMSSASCSKVENEEPTQPSQTRTIRERRGLTSNPPKILLDNPAKQRSSYGQLRTNVNVMQNLEDSHQPEPETYARQETGRSRSRMSRDPVPPSHDPYNFHDRNTGFKRPTIQEPQYLSPPRYEFFKTADNRYTGSTQTRASLRAANPVSDIGNDELEHGPVSETSCSSVIANQVLTRICRNRYRHEYKTYHIQSTIAIMECTMSLTIEFTTQSHKHIPSIHPIMMYRRLQCLTNRTELEETRSLLQNFEVVSCHLTM